MLERSVETKIETLPEWEFSIEEVSNGVYELKGRSDLGWSIELTGCDPGTPRKIPHRNSGVLD